MQKSKALFFIALVAGAVAISQSCSKGDLNDPKNPNAPSCVRENFGTLIVDNNQYWPQRIYLNEMLEDTLNGYYMQAFKVPPGDYKVKFVRYRAGSSAKQPEDSGFIKIDRCTSNRFVIH